MDIRKSDKKALQSKLKELGHFNGNATGNIDSQSLKAISAFLTAHKQLLPTGYEAWPKTRLTTAALQLVLLQAKHDPGPVDGYYGPLTRNAANWYLRETSGILVIDFDELNPEDVNPNNFPKEKTSFLDEVYGKASPPNSCQATAVKVPCPWKMRLDWDLNKTREHFWIHEKVADSLNRVLKAVFEHYGLDGIKKHNLDRFSGDNQCRNKRNGTTPSTHAYAIAIDFYGSANKLNQTTNDSVPPTLAHPELEFFWQCWEKEGWYSLGRMEDRDWMHVQAAKGKRSKFFHL